MPWDLATVARQLVFAFSHLSLSVYILDVHHARKLSSLLGLTGVLFHRPPLDFYKDVIWAVNVLHSF